MRTHVERLQQPSAAASSVGSSRRNRGWRLVEIARSANCPCMRKAVKLHLSTLKRLESDDPLCGRSIMPTSEGYGQRLADRLRAEQAHAIVTHPKIRIMALLPRYLPDFPSTAKP